MMRDVLAQTIRCEATAVASLWATACLCFALRKKEILTEAEIAEMFDPSQIASAIPEGLRKVAAEAIEHLRDQSLGKMPVKH